MRFKKVKKKKKILIYLLNFNFLYKIYYLKIKFYFN